MRNTLITRITGALLTAMLVVPCAHALSASSYANGSVLSSGRWVKVAVEADGIYELTAAELAQMGFSDPAAVRVFGQGGHALSEVLDGSQPDDLSEVGTMLAGSKLFFYGRGPINVSLVNADVTSPRFDRTINPYATKGYYFLTDSGSAKRVSRGVAADEAGENAHESSYDYFYHERELVTLSHTGKQFLGEDITVDAFDLPLSLPNLSDPTLNVTCQAGANVTASSYVRCYVVTPTEEVSVPFTVTYSKIFAPSGVDVKYNLAAPTAEVTLSDIPQQALLRTSIYSPNGTVNLAKFDYAVITYQHLNTLGDASQIRMTFPRLRTSDCIVLPTTAEGVVVWDVTDATSPVSYMPTVSTGDPTALEFTPMLAASGVSMIAFDPQREQMHIAGYEPIANQNLHGLSVPTMLIVTDSLFLPQAQRLADMHQRVDGINVAVVEQQQVFNEFSSGTPDAMAVRMLCKMLYDRDPSTFKYLLMFGHGRHDNRGLFNTDASTLITYESDASNDERSSFVSDDFFGFLLDGSGQQLTSDRLCLGVGRITCATADEARIDVDKIINYVENADYGPWRNNLLAIADAYDDGLHMCQAEGVANLWQNTLAPAMYPGKLYIDMYPRTVSETTQTDELRRTSSEARRALIQTLDKGVYFATYVGHASPALLTKYARLWSSTDVTATPYTHLPIMSTACCDVARYDSDSRGIAELMFHKPDGGAIALLTSARQVLADDNDQLNCAFISALFNNHTTGTYTTLGDAYMTAKHDWGTTSNVNKMSFLLLGDPAMRVNYPKPLFKVVSVNGNNAENTINVQPLDRLDVVANVLKADGTIDTDFSGNATVTLYDAQRYFTALNYRDRELHQYVTRSIYTPRTELVQVAGRVDNGVLHASVVVPRYVQADSSTIMLTVYAHCDGTDRMVNGSCSTITVDAFDGTGSGATADQADPVIDAMYVGDEDDFAAGIPVSADARLTVIASDDYALNVQPQNAAGTLKLVVDGNAAAYYNAAGYATLSDNGQQLTLDYPLSGLAAGQHTAQITVSDVSGHSTTRTISFVVGNAGTLELAVDESPAGEVATFTVAATTLARTPLTSITVLDAAGTPVWTSTATTNFPVQWNLRNHDGNRVPAGLYKFFGTYSDGTLSGGTTIQPLVVVDP